MSCLKKIICTQKFRIESLIRPIAICRDAIMVLRFDPQNYNEVEKLRLFNVLKTIEDIVRSVWHPTLMTLKSLSARPGPTQEMWECLSSFWRQTGEAFSLNPSSRDVRNPKPWPELALGWKLTAGDSRKGCGWKDCLCVIAPAHPLKVCKGCWRQFYCSTKCQTR